MHAQWVDGPDSTWQHLQNAGPDEARDRAQNVSCGLVEAIAREWDANDGKARLVRWAYLALAAALVLTIAEAVTLGWKEVSR